MEMSSKRKAESHSRAANRPRIIKSGGSRTDSERDSGFSDAGSEHMSTRDTMTDSEDSPRPAAQKRSQPSRLAVMGGSYSNLSSMIIMNNVLLKQPGDNPPPLKSWGFSPKVEVVQPTVVQQPQVVFLQPVVSRQASPAPKDSSSRHRRPKKYLPILKSYPKIAPHPGDSSSSSGRGTGSSSSSTTSSSSSESKRGRSSTSSHREHCRRERQQQRSQCSSACHSRSSTPSLPSSPSTTSPLLQSQLTLSTTESSACSGPARERPSSTVSQSEFTTSLSLSHTTDSRTQTVSVPQGPTDESCSPEMDDGDGNDDTKRKRFSNTYNILSKSGLLDIALRTKELHRENRRTQSDIDQLKADTDLFLKALMSGDTSICLKLLASFQEEDTQQERAAYTSLKAD